MSQSTIKKNRKEIRRAVNTNFGEGLAALSNLVTPRPRWIPKWLWIIAYLPLFKWKYVGLIYKHLK